MNKRYGILEAFLRGRFSLLLVSIVAMFFVVPLSSSSQRVIDEVFGWFSIAILLSCLRAISQSRRFFIIMVLLTIVNVLLSSSEIMMHGESGRFIVAALLFKVGYFFIVFISIMRFVLNNEPVSGDKICGAISAYLLMGIIWSFVYALFHYLNPDSFSVPEAWLSTDTVNSFWAVYFSFTTLTTLGYGDVTPEVPLTQSYAVMQAAIGQIFLAVIIARLIALHITAERDPTRNRID